VAGDLSFPSPGWHVRDGILLSTGMLGALDVLDVLRQSSIIAAQQLPGWPDFILAARLRHRRVRLRTLYCHDNSGMGGRRDGSRSTHIQRRIQIHQCLCSQASSIPQPASDHIHSSHQPFIHPYIHLSVPLRYGGTYELPSKSALRSRNGNY
jgi:hypothetical protein